MIGAIATATLEALEPRTLLAATTTDPYFAKQTYLASSDIDEAWETTRGSSSLVVADIDTGADYSHQDLFANIWINQAEIPSAVKSQFYDTDGDGVISLYDLNNKKNRSLMTDVNQNGYIDAGDLLSPLSQGGWEDGINGQSNANDVYIDDLIGWDFAENDNDPFDDGGANQGHGTHTAGILGAMGNNAKGISGVIQKVAMMIVRIFGDDGTSGNAWNTAAAIRYSADSGARVANASWGGSFGYDGDVIYNAIAYAGHKGQLFVTATGNSGRNLDSPFFSSYPAEYNLDNIVVVGASDGGDGMAWFSNYGAANVDIFAAGVSILSTLPGNRFGRMSGTSMATPIVAGAAALMLAANPGLSTSQLKAQLIEGADETPVLNDRAVSDGKLNLNNAMLVRAGNDVVDSLNPNTGGSGTVIFLPFGRSPFASGRLIDGLPGVA